MALISAEDLGRIVEQLKGAGYNVVKEEKEKRVIWDENMFGGWINFRGRKSNGQNGFLIYWWRGDWVDTCCVTGMEAMLKKDVLVTKREQVNNKVTPQLAEKFRAELFGVCVL